MKTKPADNFADLLTEQRDAQKRFERPPRRPAVYASGLGEAIMRALAWGANPSTTEYVSHRTFLLPGT